LIHKDNKVIAMPKILLLSVITLLSGFIAVAETLAADVTVYKSPYCGCCTKWSAHLRDNGFNVTENKVKDVGLYKKRYGIPTALSSCHTAVIAGYVIEGHVPASDIRRLLLEKPDIRGLTVPGMASGSPGMEQGRVDSYSVLAIRKDGTTYLYHSYPGK
jgi:hypothetical protein